VKDLLEKKFPDIWLEGEISNFKLHSMGHMYFSLKDEEAQINAVMYKGLTGQLKFLPEDGMKVLIKGKISLFNKRGQYQIIAFEIQPAGKGALQVAFEQLKERLRQEGLFDEARKRPIPLLPQKIGIITSPTGAAIKDILTVIKRRFANVEVLIDPVRVQGDEAAGEIVQAIREMNDNFPELDVLILARGGGSLEDLWAFNEEKVARAIYDSRLPIISAIGHDVDFTIADFVADLRAPTPSVAAELVVKNKEELIGMIKSFRVRLANNLRHVYELYKGRYKRVRDSMVFRRPMELVNQLQQELDNLVDRMLQTAAHFIEIQKSEFNLLIEKLNILNPLAILGRGYSITYKLPEQKIVKDTREVTPGDKVRIKLHKGKIICSVEQKEEV
ncbi:MAG: exodeoxyribonuclease VII large subunit, partial [bacterium]